MHPHMIFGVVLHTTLLAIVAYALLFSASKAQGIVALIGRVLAIWVFILAVLSAVAFFVMPKHLADQDHRYMMMWQAGPGMHPPPGMPMPPPGPPGMQPPPGGQPVPPPPKP